MMRACAWRKGWVSQAHRPRGIQAGKTMRGQIRNQLAFGRQRRARLAEAGV